MPAIAALAIGCQKPTDYIRGTGYIFAPDDYVPTEGKHPELSLRLKQESGLAPTAVFSACLAEETNFEYFDACQSPLLRTTDIRFL